MEFHWILEIGLYAAGVLIVIGVMLGLPALLGERHWQKPDRRHEIATGVPYESGIHPTGNTHIRFPIQYYLVAMLFVIFDLEAVFLYAWAVAARETGWPGFIEAAIFATILLAALFYLWRVGALDWSAQFLQRHDAQKGCPARPQRAKRRGVRFGTLSL